MVPPLFTPGPVTTPSVLPGMTRMTVAEVLGADRRLTFAVVRTASPGMNPPGGRVAVRLGADPPGVWVLVGGAGVRVGVTVGMDVR